MTAHLLLDYQQLSTKLRLFFSQSTEENHGDYVYNATGFAIRGSIADRNLNFFPIKYCFRMLQGMHSQV